jgi:hypothetical protein
MGTIQLKIQIDHPIYDSSKLAVEWCGLRTSPTRPMLPQIPLLHAVGLSLQAFPNPTLSQRSEYRLFIYFISFSPDRPVISGCVISA